MAHQYFVDEATTSWVAGAQVTLPPAESRHASKVARLRVGETVQVSDGAGHGATGTAETVTSDNVAIRITKAWQVDRPATELVLVQALAKGDRDERAIEQATEFGVDTIIPWQAERSVSRWQGEAKVERGISRWRSIVREASKQAMRLRIPEVRSPLDSSGLAREIAGTPDISLVLHPGAEASLSWAMAVIGESVSAAEPVLPERILLFVGPEGGISPEELGRFSGVGATPVALGTSVMRTSSAGPAAIAIANLVLGRW